MIAIRGAITATENTKEAILFATHQLLEEVIRLNQLKDEEMIDIFFSATRDLTAVYPAVAARKMGITNASLLCLQEMYVEDSLMMCIRLLMHVNKDIPQDQVRHAYMGEAEKLRPDLLIKELYNEQ